MSLTTAIPPPDLQTLIPPLLACLPTAFASHKPPPAFAEQLSPILRQRLDFHTSTSSGHDSWLRLLCWDNTKAETLKETIENTHFEPHPASGELEVGEVDRLSYKRYDSETLKAQVPLSDWSLTALYLWCTGSEDGNAWKLAELIPYDSDLSQDQSWSDSQSEADEKANIQSRLLNVQQPQLSGRRVSIQAQEDGANDDDDDYWNQYDKSGMQTPARKQSVNPNGSSSETDYYAQYGDVQPAMDGYDPDEQHEELGESTLNGDSIQQMMKQNSNLYKEHRDQSQASQQALERLDTHDIERSVNISQPVPASPSSRAGSDMVNRLEETADRYSASEIAIKQHISYSVKSMYRLAKGAGMSKQEFEDMVQRELDTLSILDRED